MIQRLLIGIILFTSTITLAQSDSSLLYKRIPLWAQKALERSELISNYTIVDSINPFYLEDDFNGDGEVDIVFFIEQKLSKEAGVFIINGGKNIGFVLGAGKPIGMGSTISWCNQWFVYRARSIYNFDARQKKLLIKANGIELRKTEDKSIIIYWDRRTYKTAIKKV
ncbi:MAG: hypothetical protein ACI837_000378 [Crocinitomicaceae bacterium]|jgi:hypothetical protein